MKKIKYMPYNFNEKYEFKTYKNIGKSSKIYYTQNNSLMRIWNKLRDNKREKKYKNLNTYSDWEKYVIDKIAGKYAYSVEYYNNFLHYLKWEKRYYKSEQNVVISLFIPILILIVTGAVTILPRSRFAEEGSLALLVFGSYWIIFIVIVIMIFLIGYFFKVRKNRYYYFYKDYIKIAELYEKKSTSHQN